MSQLKWILVALAFCATLASTLASADETYFQFELSSRSQLSTLTRVISIDKVTGHTVFAYANDRELEKFRHFKIPYQPLRHPGDVVNPVMIENPNPRASNWDAYPTYTAYEQMMAEFPARYPELCSLYDIGKTSKGRRLLALKISGNAAQNKAKPEFFYSSTMHGDETTGYVLMLRMIDYLLSNYGADPRVTRLVDGVEIWITPLANPDGTYRQGNNTVQGARRYNGNDVDLNRNFPDPGHGQHPDGESWQPETEAMMKFADDHHFTMGANFHGGAEVVNYPWDSWKRRHADDAWFQLISNGYVDLVHAIAPNYMTDEHGGVTNGYDWYEVDGGRQDFMNYFHQCREITIELSSTKLVNASDLPRFWNYNRDAMLGLMEESLYGINGIVLDQEKGTPVQAKIEIENHDLDNSFVTSTAGTGDFHRPIAPGTYNLKVSAEGHQPLTIQGVTVKAHEATSLQIELPRAGLRFN